MRHQTSIDAMSAIEVLVEIRKVKCRAADAAMGESINFITFVMRLESTVVFVLLCAAEVR